MFEKNGVIYFSNPPANIKPSKDSDPQNKSKWSFWRRENFKFFKEELEKLKPDVLLADIGAGQSDFSEITSRFNLAATDFYPYEGINVVCDFTAGMPFKNESIDIILISNVLEHISEPAKFLEECSRTLKKGGALLGSVPFIIGIHQRPYDFFRYTDINLKKIFGIVGFSRLEIKPVLAMHTLFFNISAIFFTNLITKTEFSKNKFLNCVAILLIKILWKVFRVGFNVLKPLYRSSFESQDWPLGYLFKAVKI